MTCTIVYRVLRGSLRIFGSGEKEMKKIAYLLVLVTFSAGVSAHTGSHAMINHYLAEHLNWIDSLSVIIGGLLFYGLLRYGFSYDDKE